MKRCVTCKLNKSFREFHKKTPTTYQSSCKDCRKIYVRRHYELNRQAYIARSAVQRQKVCDWVKDLRCVPCLDCGQRYPHYVMQFDHVRGIKKGNVMAMVGRVSHRTLKEEIAKCEIVCANCHAIRTHSRLHSSDGRAAES